MESIKSSIEWETDTPHHAYHVLRLHFSKKGNDVLVRFGDGFSLTLDELENIVRLGQVFEAAALQMEDAAKQKMD